MAPESIGKGGVLHVAVRLRSSLRTFSMAAIEYGDKVSIEDLLRIGISTIKHNYSLK